jgi:Na+/H+ antiporter NhaD/arsenite permease-like protein
MIHTLSSWLSHPWITWGVGIFSLVAVLASVVLVPRFLAKLPGGYLNEAEPPPPRSLPLRILRNVLGGVLVLLGVAMLLLPGQGLLTLLVGVLLVDFPGKHAFVVRVLSRPKVLAIVNKLRTRHGAAPLAR